MVWLTRLQFRKPQWRSAFHSIESVPPKHTLSWQQGMVQTRWAIRSYTKSTSGSAGEEVDPKALEKFMDPKFQSWLIRQISKPPARILPMEDLRQRVLKTQKKYLRDILDRKRALAMKGPSYCPYCKTATSPYRGVIYKHIQKFHDSSFPKLPRRKFTFKDPAGNEVRFDGFVESSQGILRAGDKIDVFDRHGKSVRV
ncbi:hypothetical protein BJV82DRAFT_575135 [Fennellomyces sp. T-0311]|nr:hypothetical protein BJV82DRAFT_575135 [Fennellomyces sp. T-0311]